MSTEILVVIGPFLIVLWTDWQMVLSARWEYNRETGAGEHLHDVDALDQSRPNLGHMIPM